MSWRATGDIYKHTTEGLRGYFFIPFLSQYMSPSIFQVLKDHDLLQKISLKKSLFNLSKVHVIADGARRTPAEIPKRSKNVADLFGLKLYLKILSS